MNPVGYNWQTKVPSASIDIVSFKSPTVPCQHPTISIEYSAVGTVDKLLAQDAAENSTTITAIAVTQIAHLALFIDSPVFMPLRPALDVSRHDRICMGETSDFVHDRDILATCGVAEVREKESHQGQEL